MHDVERSFQRTLSSARKFFFLAFLSSISVGAADQDSSAHDLTEFERRLIALPADTWYEAPNSHMQEVCAPPSFGVNAVMGCRAIILAWGGGAYDANQRKMMIWGGGHNDYWGNEVYVFDLREGHWERMTDPTPGNLVSEAKTDPLPDGLPNSRHTYDGLQYISRKAQMFAHGGAISPGGGGTSVTWIFDMAKRSWHIAAESGGPGGYALASGYDPASGQVIVRGTKGLWSYDVDTSEWSALAGFGYAPFWPRYEVSGDKRGAVDTKRQLFWSVGSNDLLVWDIRRKEVVTNDWATFGAGEYSNRTRLRNYAAQIFESGGGEVFNASAPGFDFDSKADQFVAWKGGPPYILDLPTKEWHIGSATGAPSTQASNGTFGRWRYLPEYNVFILVNSVSSNVFFYKNRSGGP